ncbi:hypothetical protein BJ322DRAFT_459428 [Thelephora terrestris]|uniref:Uncharacterized protein n=1 Tax=Thelephora terrestris TaxID=56493 RepID=A0A9P6H3S8_9AGAM|nr:hypothetical protein BJ322DRAFT_459428 [Thelephora terrestris]
MSAADPHPTSSSQSLAAFRLGFPPSYVLVGVYRLSTDASLRVPVLKKCKNGFIRGILVGLAWAFFTFGIQKGLIRLFLSKSSRVTGLSHRSLFGYPLPFELTTLTALFAVGAQVNGILNFFLRRNVAIAKQRVWDQTIASRGKGASFWKPYVEEWDHPPAITKPGMQLWLSGTAARFIVRKVLLYPVQIYPFVGIFVSAYFKALGTGSYLHKPYFEAKGMTEPQVAIFVEERKWHYRAFGFCAAVLEDLPIIGIFFSVSNRIGAAMWAHDLEKRQHLVARQKGLKLD